MVYNWMKFKQTCLLCDETCDGPVNICTACELELPWLGAHCKRCAVPLPQADLMCGSCLKKPPAFNQVITAWRYAFPVDALITRFKHQSNWPYGQLLGALLARHLQQAFADGLAKPQLLLPVPLARQRLRQRGFNQAAMLAHWLAGALHLPVNEQLLQRTKDTPAQQQLNAAARKRNLRHAFGLTLGEQVSGQHLALVDDVLTTGATADTLARLLLRAGAASVDVYCLARTPAPGELQL